MNYFIFQKTFSKQGIFSVKQINLMFSGFNNDNLLYWQKKGYLIKLRNGWYCFQEFLTQQDTQLIIANNIYSPSYISHQQALMYYGLIPEHIVDSVSITTRKTASFLVNNRNYKYYSIKKEYFFGYRFLEVNVNGMKRNVLMAEPEKAILDLLYIFNFYKTEQDISDLRLNETILAEEIDWTKMNNYLKRFHVKELNKKIDIIKKINNL